MANRTKYKNITHIPGQIRITLPNGQTWTFKNSTAAQQFFDKNYASQGYHMELRSTTDNKGEVTINGGTLPEVVVVGKAPDKPATESPSSNSSGLSPFERYMNVKIGNNREANRRYKDKFYRISDWESLTRTGDAAIDPSYWDSETYRNFRAGSDLAAAYVTAPFALYGLNALYASSPYIAGAMNLDAAYHGLGRLTSKDGVQKTWNHIKNGEWGDAALSAGGDILDTAMSLPFLSRTYQGAKWLGNRAAGEALNQGINRFSPYYTSEFNWRTGRINITPRPGVNVPEGAPVKFGTPQGLPSPTLSLLGGSAPEARAAVGLSEQPVRTLSLGARETPTYGSMNEVADAIEAGILPTNEEIAAASGAARLGGETRPIRFYGGEEVGELPIVVNGRPLPPSTLPGGVFNPEYYRAIATHFNRPIETPDGLAIFPTVASANTPEFISIDEPNPFQSGQLDVNAQPFEDQLPPPPAEINLNDSGTSPVEDFDWGAFEQGTLNPTPNTAQYNDMFDRLGLSQNTSTSWADHRGNLEFTLQEDGSFRYAPAPGMNMLSTTFQPSEVEEFLTTARRREPYLQGTYNGLDDLIIRTGWLNRYNARNPARNVWRLNYQHPSGVELPVRLRDVGGMGQLGARGQSPIEFPLHNQPIEFIYQKVEDYLSGIQGTELTPEQLQIIQSQFPNNRGSERGRMVFARGESRSSSPTLSYDPLSGKVEVSGRGFNNGVWPISSLTPELISPVRVPEIITSSSLPAFSRISQGTDWGQVLGIDPRYSAQINFGLGRPRPTFDQVSEALGQKGRSVFHQGDADFYLETLSPYHTTQMPLIETPYDVPNIHLNMTPWGGELSGPDKRYVATQMGNLSKGAKGADIASTGNVNPTLSRFVSDLAAATNLSDMDKYNLLVGVLRNPDQFFGAVANHGDYSPFSWSENALKGENTRRFFTEPALNTTLGGFNNYGNTLENSLKEALHVNPTFDVDPTTGARTLINGSPDIPFTPENIGIINQWMQKNTPNFYQFLPSNDVVPFPVTTIRKKGGKLVKKKNLI